MANGEHAGVLRVQFARHVTETPEPVTVFGYEVVARADIAVEMLACDFTRTHTLEQGVLSKIAT